MRIYQSGEFPFAEFGENPVRKIRLMVSPETTGEENCDIVMASLPPGAISEGHVHPESDEYIYFDIGGVARIDGEEYVVLPKSIVHAQKGSVHECVNTDTKKELTLVCVFVPPFEPYGKYPELIDKTKKMLEEK
jgi:quercetin dioxygenase-like cupin family protein